MDRCGRWWYRRRSDFRHHNRARLCHNGHRQKLGSRLLRSPPGAISILVSPLKDLVGVDPVLSRNPRNRCARNKGCLDDAALLRRGTMNPFRRGTGGNLNRLAHKVIVDLIAPSVYTARSGRLRKFASSANSNVRGKTSPQPTGARAGISTKRTETS